MRAMLLHEAGRPLAAATLVLPPAGPGEVRVKVAACGVCRTDLHIRDGELPRPKLPLVLGHEVVGRIETVGTNVTRLRPGMRVGIPWLGWTCGVCRFCTAGQENLCERARFTGYDRDGGYAEYAIADHRYCFPLPDGLTDSEAAPLLCAGLIGYRALRMAGDAEHLGIYGFGAAAHLIAQVARHQGRSVYAFTRPGDRATQRFADDLGAAWSGGSDEVPPLALDAALIFAPVGALVPAALATVRAGGTVVCAGIHMSDIPSFPYRLLWGERIVRSVANLTRQDAHDLLALVADVRPHVHAVPYPLADAERALDDLRHGRFDGAAVLVP